MVTLGWNIFGLIVFLNISLLTTKYLVTHRSIRKFVKFVVINNRITKEIYKYRP